MAKNLIPFFAALAIVLSALAAQQAEKPQDVWTPLKFFIGSWEGKGEGKPGISTGRQEWESVLRGRYLLVRNVSRFEPQEGNPKSETHEDWGFFSFDQMRKKYVLRQFHGEGFVNQYICDGPSADGKTLVFVSEAIENIPAGWQARLTYHFLSEDSFEQTFDLAAPGQEMECYSKGIMRRIK